MADGAIRFGDYERLLIPALRHSDAGTSMDNVRRALASGDALLWPGQRSAAVTTEYHGHELVIWLAGGDMAELFEMEKAATTFARARGLDRMCVNGGRTGWQRALKRLGYRQTVQMVKDL